MKGLPVQLVENSEGERFDSRGMRFCGGMSIAYGPRGVWAQKKGLYSRSEKRFSHRIREGCFSGILLYVENQVPRQVMVEGEDLEIGILSCGLTSASSSKIA